MEDEPVTLNALWDYIGCTRTFYSQYLNNFGIRYSKRLQTNNNKLIVTESKDFNNVFSSFE